MKSSFVYERSIPIFPCQESNWETLQIKEGSDGLVPAVIQDGANGKALMLGYLNAKAWEKTLETGLVTFYSRSRNQLWTKGETSGNYLQLLEAVLDCDRDTFLFKVKPTGPVCHTGARTCWGEEEEKNVEGFPFIRELEHVIQSRRDNPTENSYTSSLFAAGLPKMAQKVGEEAVETVIEALGRDRELLLNEAADLIFHLLVLLAAKEVSLTEVEMVLQARHHP